jgi:Flp pilus assembly secretin CpaC
MTACALGLALLLTTISITWAADQTIILKLGAGSPLMLERPFETVLIGDPSIVDVDTRGDRSVVLEPLNLGATNLIFVDERRIAIANIRVLVCRAGATQINYQDSAVCEQADIRGGPRE